MLRGTTEKLTLHTTPLKARADGHRRLPRRPPAMSPAIPLVASSPVPLNRRPATATAHTHHAPTQPRAVSEFTLFVSKCALRAQV